MPKKSKEELVRRSGRQRKALYRTLNQTCLFNQIGQYIFPDGSKNMGRRVKVDSDSEEEILDIYSHVQRRKRRISDREQSRNIVFDTEESNQSPLTGNGKKGSNGVESSVEDEEEQIQRRYFLRQQTTAPDRFTIDNGNNSYKKSSNGYDKAFHSSANKKAKPDYTSKGYLRKLANAGSTTTSSSDESDDEKRFQRRRQKSLARSRARFLPSNMAPKNSKVHTAASNQALPAGIIGADLDPMSIDTKIGFKDIGGLGHHLQALREMILFPMLYPEVFEKFKITPPRGVIFYGPPGTGKTLVARALANECSKGDNRKVAFFMRKGADCLSKWVGESERQLRLLFDQAYMMRPSIIFFDEIDGLAPVRSSRQDQIHSSIVSTLLALMDGLDQRGEVIVIGATNRLDAVDPALRRPGRFDRELLFKLPDVQARSHILKIHTADWHPRLTDTIVDQLSKKLVGYCGADIKGVCTEAALLALRRKFPQIYGSDQRLLLDHHSITVTANDFDLAMTRLVPSTKRISYLVAKQLPTYIRPLMECYLRKMLDVIGDEFKPRTSPSVTMPPCSYASVLDVFKTKRVAFGQKLLLYADGANHGQTNYLAPALFHILDHLPIFSLSLSQVFSAGYKSPEEAVSEILATAAKFSPCILFVPTIDVLMQAIPHSAWYTFLSVVQSWCNSLSILLVASSNQPYESLDCEIKMLFDQEISISIYPPYTDMRRRFFVAIFKEEILRVPVRLAQINYPHLPVAPPPSPPPLNSSEMKRFQKLERQTMRELRIFLREILSRLMRDKRFIIFSKPVDPEQAPDYPHIIAEPMDLSMMMSKIDQHKYTNVDQFLADIDLITRNALEYNPERDQTDKCIRHRACSLRDVVNAIIEQEYDSDFDQHCTELEEFRKQRHIMERGDQPPDYVYLPPNANGSMRKCNDRAANAIVKKYDKVRLAASRSKSPTGSYNNQQSRSRSRSPCKTTTKKEPQDASDESGSDSSDPSSTSDDESPTVRSRGTKITYSEVRYNAFLDLAVSVTTDWTVGQLDKLYSKMMRKIDQYSAAFNKNELLEELDVMLRSYK